MIYSYLIISLVCIFIILLLNNKKLTHAVVYLFGFFQIYFCYELYTHPERCQNEYFSVDSIGVLFTIILAVLSLVAAVHYQKYETLHKEDIRSVKIHNAVYIGFNAALVGVYLSGHYGLLWAFIEATTLTGATLIYHDRKKIVLEAVWKYVFACSVSITLAFTGILLLSVAAQEIKLSELSFELLAQNAQIMNPVWLKAAFIFILVGFSVKMGVSPMFNVDIDAKDVSPFPIGALFSSVLLNAGFLAIYRFYSIFKDTEMGVWMNHVLVIASVLTLLFASAHLLKAKNYKRLFAYSSMEHSGLVLIAITLGKLGILAAFLHLTFHAVVKSGLFFQIGQVIRLNQGKKEAITGYFYQNPLGGFILLFGSLAIMALPPSGLFISELLIFKSLLLQQNGLIIVLIFSLLSIIFYALLTSVFKLLFYPSTTEKVIVKPKTYWLENLLQLFLLGLSVYFGLFQSQFLIDLIQASL